VTDTKSQASSLKKFEKILTKSLKKTLPQLLTTQEPDSDISASDGGESLFQIAEAFQFTQVENTFEPTIAKLFQQAWKNSPRVRNDGKSTLPPTFGSKTPIDLRQVILLDSQSTMDLFCNRSFLKKSFRSKKSMRLKSNGGTMVVTQQAQIKGYHADVWYDKNAITNILALKNVIKQYRVTYDSDDQTFVVHRESENRPNMEFLMHESGLHYYISRNKSNKSARTDGTNNDPDFVFVETVSGNKEGFSKRQIKGAEAARTLYSTLSYPSWNDFKWVIRSNKIKDCPVTVEDVDTAHQIWGKNIAALLSRCRVDLWSTCEQQRARSRNRATYQGCQGALPCHSAQLTIHAHSQTSDDPHCH
jgi:hypothetical protein